MTTRVPNIQFEITNRQLYYPGNNIYTLLLDGMSRHKNRRLKCHMIQAKHQQEEKQADLGQMKLQILKYHDSQTASSKS
jgi:hypothetical protein